MYRNGGCSSRLSTIFSREIGLAVLVGWLIGGLDVGQLCGEEYVLHRFDRQRLTETYFSEGVGCGDLNGDGHEDIVYGPYWFEGPTFSTKHEIYAPVPQPMEKYADHFFAWVYDFDEDGARDVFTVGFPGTPAYVYQNPGKGLLHQHWKKKQVIDWVSNESPHFTDIVGDSRPELVCTRDSFFGFATIDWTQPFSQWAFHPISEKIAAERFGHGLGVGDINGDGRLDIIRATGWFEQPAKDPEKQRWREHKAKFTHAGGGAEMYAYDVDGDGDNDVITSLAAHEFGLAWYEQIREGDEIRFVEHLIMGSHVSENRYGVLFSELHSVQLADMDGDGLKDIVTGKTYYSHHQKSPMWDAGPVVYWFKLVRGPQGVDWIPYLADEKAGIGRQIVIHDVNGDGLLDIVTGGMLGSHVLFHQRRSVDEQAWKGEQPKVYVGPKSKGVLGAEVSARSPFRLEGAIEGESLMPTVTGGTVRTQAMGGFTADAWSGDKQLWWTGAKPGHLLSFDFTVPEKATVLEVVLTCARNYGIVRLAVDGEPLNKSVDLYRNQVVTSGVLTFPISQLSAGNHRFSVEIVGANPQAQPAYMVGIDYLRIRMEGDGLSAAPARRVMPPPSSLATDEYPHTGLSAEKAAEEMKLPEGFSVTVCAAEPEIQQPIAMALDDRGRTWVAEAYEYPMRAEGDLGRDRILIFEDKDGDGKFDSRKVFAEGLNLVSGLEVGFGGVWVGAAPYLLFIPDRNGDDIPDAAPQRVLDGWGYQDTHETLNSFLWGPDGWLYGCHGVFTHSKVGKPGTPEEQRVPINAGVWRYHPTRQLFEVFAHGTSNPWGIDFNEKGDAFVTACVIPHLFHLIPGGRYHRQAGEHFDPHTYNDIKTIADHLHYLGATPHSGNGKSDAAGGGHAHAGAMIYQGASWPEKYCGALFMNNIHGQRLNIDLLQPKGSGYVGTHGPDFLLARDVASQILSFRYGPDGQVTMIDWYDMQACHSRDASKHDRTNGRIYKVSYGTPKVRAVDLAQQSDLELAGYVTEPNEWYFRHARRLLQERASVRRIERPAIELLERVAKAHHEPNIRLRGLWALHGIGGLDAAALSRVAMDPDPSIRGWALRLSLDRPHLDSSVESLWNQLLHDASPKVRLSMASALQKIAVERRWELLERLPLRAEDAEDHNLPLMWWYAVEPLAELDPDRALAWSIQAGEKIPLLREFMLRRIGEGGSEASVARLVKGLKETVSPTLQASYLSAIKLALAGQRSVTKPDGWEQVAARIEAGNDTRLKEQVTLLGATFGDSQAIERLRGILGDLAQPSERRLQAIEALVAARDQGSKEALLQIAAHSANGMSVLREPAIRALAIFDDAAVANRLISLYAELSGTERRAAMATLCSRSGNARKLLESIEEKRIAATELTADLARQIEYLGDDEAKRLLKSVWGQVRQSPQEKTQLIEQYRQLIGSRAAALPDENLGRAVFAKTCQRCHILYGVGQHLGPDLTGSNRSNLDYLLENVVDPSAVMANEYRPSIVLTDSGQVISGIIRQESEKTLTLQTADATVIVPKEEIEQRQLSEKSMMPDDQLNQFQPHEVRSLFAYLRGKTQVPILAAPDNAAQFFNQQDLTGWKGEPALWSVQNGEIVGKSNGLERNEFLISDFTADNFLLTAEILLVDNRGNSGIQFRSVARSDGSVEGYQADVGPGWWGKLYEEHGRKILWDESGESHVKPGDWNLYSIEANGARLRTSINGKSCVDLEDPAGRKRGIFAFQLHAGGPTEVRIRKIQLKVFAEPNLMETKSKK